VKRNTLFWNASGFDAALTTEGFEIDTVSLTSLLIGGISFETPRGTAAGAPGESQVFALYKNKRATANPAITVRRPFLLYFDQSVAGLAVGSPVEFRGVQVGEVTDVRMDYSESGLPRIPVRIAMEPERTGLGLDSDPEELRRRSNSLVESGMRAQLKTGNLLTGQLIVSLDFFPDAEPAEIDWSGPIPELPTISGGIDQLMSGLAVFTDKLSALPLEEIGKDLQESIASLNVVLEDVKRATPALVGTLQNAEATLGSANTLIAPESPLANDLKRAMRELAQAAHSLRLLAEQLQEQPESLLRGKQ
jgi:paraquat-inducible protein B